MVVGDGGVRLWKEGEIAAEGGGRGCGDRSQVRGECGGGSVSSGCAWATLGETEAETGWLPLEMRERSVIHRLGLPCEDGEEWGRRRVQIETGERGG